MGRKIGKGRKYSIDMISNLSYIKRNEKNQLMYFENTWEGRETAYDYTSRKGIDGIKWSYGNKDYVLFFKEKDFANKYISNDMGKIFICYKGISPSFPAPNNLVIYTPTGEVEKILTTPILPTGKKAVGFLQIGEISVIDKSTIPNAFKNGLEVWVWEHEESPWVYHYYFNPDTYEFLFFNKSTM